MGYDHFAIIALAEEPNEKKLKLIEKTCQVLRTNHVTDTNEPLFGNVFHLSAGGFNAYWWSMFDEFMTKLYNKTKIGKMYLYVCEFDGESLHKYEYVDGKR